MTGPTGTAARWPDFFLVGAPKAGTTSLYAYLAAHPDVFLPERKELRFFGSDLEVRHRRTFDRSAFLAEYVDAPAGALLGNAYVWYLASATAADEIHAVRPDARIVVMLRDPVDAIVALHSEFVYDGNEDLEDLADALAAEPDRCAGRRIPAEAHFPAGLCYRRTVRYAEQLERFLDRFGRDQVHVVVFDDFAADPRAVYLAVLAFLGLDPAPAAAFERHNPNKRSRSALLRRVLAAPPEPARRLVRRLLPRGLRRAAYRRAVAMNTRLAERAPAPEDLRRSLRAELAGEVAALEALLNRPLPGWRAA